MSMTDTPLVSILMTSYNREKYIEEAIKSVLNSTYTNWELIIVDDVSTDKTVQIAQTWKQHDNRIQVYVNEKNLTDYPNRNKAASYAKGKYLKYLDADDMLYPHGLALMVECMEKFPEAALGVMPRNHVFAKPIPFALSPWEAYETNFIKGVNLFSRSPLSLIFTKRHFDLMNGFKPVRHYGDHDLITRLAAQYDTVVMHGDLAWWRSHDDQESKRRKKKKPIIDDVVALIDTVCADTCTFENGKKKLLLSVIFKKYFRKLMGRKSLYASKLALQLYRYYNKRKAAL